MELFLIIFGCICLSEIVIYFAEKNEKEKESLKQFLVYLKDGRIAIVEGNKIKIKDDVYLIGDSLFKKEVVDKIIKDKIEGSI